MQLSTKAANRRKEWIAKIENLSGRFSDDSERMAAELNSEVRMEGAIALRDHLHMCGAIPESYGHDTSEEKLYSKYTDVLLSLAFRHIGLASSVYTERADAADVEAVAPNYSLVADAKAFRLSRTAKNQKDFKVQAMHGWKRGKPYALVVCPIYQLPSSSSQIYQQAIAHDVCIFTYSHLALLVSLSELSQTVDGVAVLHNILRAVVMLNPTKDATAYWSHINRVMLETHPVIRELWQDEKLASLASVTAAKEEALTILSLERDRIMRMTKEEAVAELLRKNNIDNRVRTVNTVRDNKLLDLV